MFGRQVHITGGGASALQTKIVQLSNVRLRAMSIITPETGIDIGDASVRVMILSEAGNISQILATPINDQVASFYNPSWDGNIPLSDRWSLRFDLITSTGAAFILGYITEEL